MEQQSEQKSASSNEPSGKTKSKSSKQPLMPDDAKFDAMKKEQPSQKNDSISAKTARDIYEKKQQEAIQPRKPSSEKKEHVTVADLNFKTKPTPPTQPSPAGAIVGENLQKTVKHGEYLFDFPTLSICLDFAEMALSLISVTLALIAVQQAAASVVLCINTILILLPLVALTVVQWKALHVRAEKDLNKQTRFVIDPRARHYIACIHLLRLALILSTICIVIYFFACGSRALGIRRGGLCEQIPESRALLGTSAGLLVVQASLVLFQLVFYFRNKMSVRWFS